MKRDDEFIRELLLEAEQSRRPFLYAPPSSNPSEADLKRHTHAQWLCDAGLFDEVNKGSFRIASQGHDYLNAIRDAAVWKKTITAVSDMGGVPLGVMKDMAIAYAKQEISTRLGLSL